VHPQPCPGRPRRLGGHCTTAATFLARPARDVRHATGCTRLRAHPLPFAKARPGRRELRPLGVCGGGELARSHPRGRAFSKINTRASGDRSCRTSRVTAGTPPEGVELSGSAPPTGPGPGPGPAPPARPPGYPARCRYSAGGAMALPEALACGRSVHWPRVVLFGDSITQVPPTAPPSRLRRRGAPVSSAAPGRGSPLSRRAACGAALSLEGRASPLCLGEMQGEVPLSPPPATSLRDIVIT
jgi:hypothetical protein